ncbi:hypothetical protein PUNSTDRAFT_42086 [Punctularia strigosozonata HHB-11173 SS5]|uniref:uncharacterized protein n=1 Tax=Punctularia strigosozonata (strain HHB-11173) TaxID=741275 RepID=UPI0004417C39|nr:uncharacterized protein PUNSTDRAFT_42086 [Punctularia strigosozonata HHB-11173 SS5]EIN12480.1 hypothetical protein PUNSTDRAFT_42086 [Punctularia strigosozonata HHB-11173 SS5]
MPPEPTSNVAKSATLASMNKTGKAAGRGRGKNKNVDGEDTTTVNGIPGHDNQYALLGEEKPPSSEPAKSSGDNGKKRKSVRDVETQPKPMLANAIREAKAALASGTAKETLGDDLAIVIDTVPSTLAPPNETDGTGATDVTPQSADQGPAPSAIRESSTEGSRNAAVSPPANTQDAHPTAHASNDSRTENDVPTAPGAPIDQTVEGAAPAPPDATNSEIAMQNPGTANPNLGIPDSTLATSIAPPARPNETERQTRTTADEVIGAPEGPRMHDVQMSAPEDSSHEEEPPFILVSASRKVTPAPPRETTLLRDEKQTRQRTEESDAERRRQEIATLVSTSIAKGPSGTLDSDKIVDIDVSRDSDLPPPPPDSIPEGKLAIIGDQLLANRAYAEVAKSHPQRPEVRLAPVPPNGWTAPQMRFRLQQLEDIEEEQVKYWAENDEHFGDNVLVTIFDRINLTADEAQDVFGEVRATVQAFLKEGASLRIILPVAANKRQPRTGLLSALTTEDRALILSQGVFATADIAFYAFTFDDVVVNPSFYLTLKGPIDADEGLMLYAVQVALAEKASDIVAALGMDPKDRKAIGQVNSFLQNLNCRILPFLAPKGRPQPRYNIYGPIINSALPCAYRDVQAIMRTTNFWHAQVGPVDEIVMDPCTFCYGVDHVYGLCPIRTQIPQGFLGSMKNPSPRAQEYGRRGGGNSRGAFRGRGRGRAM